LGIRDRNQRHVAESREKRQAVAVILTAMQSRQAGDWQMSEDREMEMIDVEVKHVQIGGVGAYLIQHQHVIGHDVAERSVEP
jgi:hypothetical protein